MKIKDFVRKDKQTDAAKNSTCLQHSWRSDNKCEMFTTVMFNYW